MTWIIFAFIVVFTQSLTNLFQRKLMKEKDSNPILTSIIFLFLVTIFTFIYSLFNGFVLPNFEKFTLNLIIGAILYGLSVIFTFKASQKIPASELVIISAFGSVIAIIAAVFILKETFGMFKIIGSFLIISSTIFIYDKKKTKINIGILYAILMTICSGLAVVNDTFILKSYDPISYMVVMSFLPIIVISLINPKAYLSIHKYFKLKTIKNILFLSFSQAIQGSCYYIALSLGANASQIAPISRASIIVTVLLASVFLKERDHLIKKIICAVLVTIGVILLVK